MSHKNRCDWCTADPLYVSYHDKEWGKPIHDSRLLFEFLMLEGMQAGLSWFIILKKREAMRKAFANFSPEKLARFNKKNIEQLLNNPEIIRHQGKIISCINGAKIYLTLEEKQSFSDYIWQFVDHQPIQNRWKTLSEVPAETAISQMMSKQLKKQGFNFVGSKICYAFMQAVGMVNDHLTGCFRYAELSD